MSSEKNHTINIINNAIVSFFILFLLTLTNSIFLNQLGYYAALILVIAKGFIEKKNPFRKSGLELAFVWFMLSELLSLVFSANPSQAMLFMLKRVLLIPIVYTSIASSFDFKKAKMYTKLYLAASLISIVIYLYFSVQYLIYDLYSVTDSGPSIFQYPITVSEITSFSVVILFAFLVHEKMGLRNRILLFIGFCLSVLALLSTYKRTGWMGAAFGIVMVLIIKKKWSILVPGLVIFIAFLFIDKNISQLSVYEYQNKNLVQRELINTPGRAFDVSFADTTVYLSDYENGLVKVSGDKLFGRIEFSNPVVSLKKWNDSFYVATLIDSRFVLLKKEGAAFTKAGEFLTPGYTNSSQSANGKFYVNDKDSGLSVFNSPSELKHLIRYSNISGYSGLLVDSGKIVFYSNEKGIDVYSLVNGLPDKKIDMFPNERTSISALCNNNIIVSDNKGVKIYSSDSLGLTLTDSAAAIKNAFKIVPSDGKLFILTSQRELFETEVRNNKLNILSSNRIDFTPLSFNVSKNIVYFTKVKRSRLLSFFDPYLSSNFVRLALWEAGFKMFKDRPLFGVGDVDLAVYYRHYKHDYNKEIQGHLHNNFIHILATLGLFGLLAVLFLFFKYYQLSFRIYSKNKLMPFAGSFALGVIGCFSAFLVSGLTELNFWDHEIASLIWFLFGINTAFFYLITNSDNSQDK